MTDSRTLPEEWRPITGYEGRYEVSSHGRVRSWIGRNGASVHLSSTFKILKPNVHGARKYEYVTLYSDATPKRAGVHVLVAQEFHGPRPTSHHAAHEDGIENHNWASNITWKTPKQNVADKRRHGTHLEGERVPHAKLTEADVREIRQSSISHHAVGRRYGVSARAVFRIRRRKSWRHI